MSAKSYMPREVFMPNRMQKVAVTLALGTLAVISLVPPASAQAQAKASQEGPPPMTLKVGDKVPDFTLRDQNGKEVSLHDFTGKKNVVLAFFVFAFTGG
jgi:cytochrome oxidase Cu insertion factor (SCO1/SenC/PrrC family)